MNLLARPWGFELKEIKGKVLLWQGEESAALAKAAWKIAASLPDCEATFVPNRGMLWTLAHPDDLFNGLNAALARLSL